MTTVVPSSPGTLALVEQFENAIRNQQRVAKESPRLLCSPKARRIRKGSPLNRSLHSDSLHSDSVHSLISASFSSLSTPSRTRNRAKDFMSHSTSELLSGLEFSYLEQDSERYEDAMERRRSSAKRTSQSRRKASRVWIHLGNNKV